MTNPLPALSEWDNFYVIVGSASAGLTGLTFVVIALAADAKMVSMAGLRAFITPIVVHFGSVLWLAALLCVPGHGRASLAICMSASGLVGSIYACMTTYRMYRMRVYYVPALADWIWNGILPVVSYLALIVASAAMLQHPRFSLYVIGSAALLLLYIGIHNAWDLAVWITAERPGAQTGASAANGSRTEPGDSAAVSSAAVSSAAGVSAAGVHAAGGISGADTVSSADQPDSGG